MISLVFKTSLSVLSVNLSYFRYIHSDIHRYIHSDENNIHSDEITFSCSLPKCAQLPGEDTKQFVQHHNTIGNFYHHILTVLGNLTNCGQDNSIFTGDKNKQVVTLWSLDKHNISVYDYHTAVDAIQTIIDQGEGSDPCNPISWNEWQRKDLSHYFLFKAVVEERGIQVVKATPTSSTQSATATASGTTASASDTSPPKVCYSKQNKKVDEMAVRVGW